MADLDRWIEGLNRPDVAEALARQREHRKGTWVARGLMVPALQFGIGTLSIPLGFLYFGLLETGVALLIVPGLVFSAWLPWLTEICKIPQSRPASRCS